MPLLFRSTLFLDLAVQCPCVSFPGLSLLFLCLSALHVSISSPIRAMPIPDYSVPPHYISWLCLCFSKPSYAFSFLCYSRHFHAPAKPNISAAMHFFSIPSPFKDDQCRYRSVRCFSIALHIYSAALRLKSMPLLKDRCGLMVDFVPDESTLARVAPLSKTVKSSVVQPFLHKIPIALIEHHYVKLDP